VDNSGRVCRKEWDIEARLRRGENKVKLAMAPYVVTDLSLRGAPRVPRNDDVAPLRLTVLMHAAPLSPRRTRMGGRDRMLLLGTLSSLLDSVPARSVRLVVFNLDQQKEIYRQDNFLPEAFDEVAQSINSLELGTVDYRVLQNRGGHLDLLAELVNREVKAPAPSDVVVFLGPGTRYSHKPRQEEIERPQNTVPRFFYFQHRPAFPPQPAWDDSINYAVDRLKGKTIVIRSPGDLAKGIAEIERR
jgi:hypothetical protein